MYPGVDLFWVHIGALWILELDVCFIPQRREVFNDYFFNVSSRSLITSNLLLIPSTIFLSDSMYQVGQLPLLGLKLLALCRRCRVVSFSAIPIVHYNQVLQWCPL